MPPDPPDNPQAPHVCRLWRCFLCLQRLPYESSGVRTQWRNELISIFPCTASDGSVLALQETTDVDSIWIEPHKLRWAIDTLGLKHPVRFCDNGLDSAMFCAQSDPDRVVFYAHRCCWKVANVPVLNDPIVLLRLAFQTRPFDNWPTYYQSQEFQALEDPSEEPPLPLFDLGTNDLLPLDGRLFNDATDLGSLISRLGKMPLEVQFEVTKRLNLTLFLSLLRTKTLVAQLLPQIRESTTMKPETRTINGDGSFNSIHVRYRNIMGTSYLAAICFKRECGGDTSSIRVADRDMRGVQFSLGRFGVRGMRVLYEDMTHSPWLGETSSCWIGLARGRDLSRLRIVSDDLRIIRLDFSDNLDVSPERTPVMWYGQFTPSETLVKRLFPPPHPRLQQWVRRLDYYPGWRQCQYLALNTTSGYATGLTVYLGRSLDHLTGIISHGSSNLILGSPMGTPIHLPLTKGEHLTSAWLHVDGYFYGTLDCFSVTTNHGRVRHFGNYGVVRQHRCKSQSRHHHPCRWIRISDDRPARIDGIFTDANNYLRVGMITTAGVAQNEKFSQVEGGRDVFGLTYLEIPPATTALPASPFFHTHRPQFFHSTAPLNNIREIRVRRRNGRCLGMHLSYADSAVETLGQWDPTDTDSILKIYNAMDGALISLIFHTKLGNDCLREPQIELISAEVAADTSQHRLPEEVMSEYANNYDPETVSTDEFGAFCGSCGSSKCCNNTLRRESMLKVFRCSQPGQRIAWWSGEQYETVSLDDSLPQDKVKSASKFNINFPRPQLPGEDSSKFPFVFVD